MLDKLLLMCTCTWLEIWTGIGITAYLLYMHSYTLAIIATSLFIPLIGFHFAMDRISKKDGCVVRLSS